MALYCKPEAALAGDAGMKKFELDDDAVGFAKENGCFGWAMDSFGSLSRVMLCLLRLKKISAPLNAGFAWSVNLSREDNFIHCCKMVKMWNYKMVGNLNLSFY